MKANTMHRITDLLDHMPSALGGTLIAVIAGNADGWMRPLIAAVSETVTDAGVYIGLATAIVGFFTASVIALFWIRKFVLTLMHDRAAFKRGKLPKVDPGSPS